MWGRAPPFFFLLALAAGCATGDRLWTEAQPVTISERAGEQETSDEETACYDATSLHDLLGWTCVLSCSLQLLRELEDGRDEVA